MDKLTIVRGTTPEIVLRLPLPAESIAEMFATFQQLRQTVIERTLEGAETDGSRITFVLTQEETLLLDARHDIDLQMRFVATDGRRLASQHIQIGVEDINKQGVI